MAVRLAIEADAADVVEIIHQVGREERYLVNEGEAPPVAVQARQIGAMSNGSSPTRLWVATDQANKVVGMLEMMRGSFRKNAHTATLAMALMPSARGQGLGTALMQAALKWADDASVLKVSLSVFETNEVALALYRKCGFVVEAIRTHQFFIGGKYVAEVQMARWNPARTDVP